MSIRQTFKVVSITTLYVLTEARRPNIDVEREIESLQDYDWKDLAMLSCSAERDRIIFIEKMAGELEHAAESANSLIPKLKGEDHSCLYANIGKLIKHCMREWSDSRQPIQQWWTEFCNTNEMKMILDQIDGPKRAERLRMKMNVIMAMALRESVDVLHMKMRTDPENHMTEMGAYKLRFWEQSFNQMRCLKTAKYEHLKAKIVSEMQNHLDDTLRSWAYDHGLKWMDSGMRIDHYWRKFVDATESDFKRSQVSFPEIVEIYLREGPEAIEARRKCLLEFVIKFYSVWATSIGEWDDPKSGEIKIPASPEISLRKQIHSIVAKLEQPKSILLNDQLEKSALEWIRSHKPMKDWWPEFCRQRAELNQAVERGWNKTLEDLKSQLEEVAPQIYSYWESQINELAENGYYSGSI